MIVKIKPLNIANGDGIRTAIFLSGCEFKCKNCFNKDLWSFEVGKKLDYDKDIESTINEHIAGISILGGEPMHPRNREETLFICEEFKKRHPEKTIWLWTGYTLEELYCDKDETVKAIFNLLDVMVDGRFIENLKEPNLKFRGSSNQRILYKGKDF